MTYKIKHTCSDHKEFSGFTDPAWAGGVNDKKLTPGYQCVFSRGPLILKSMKQSCVALSTSETEYQ